MRFPRELFWTASAVVYLAGCDCGGTIGNPCASDSDCATGEMCVDGVCSARLDAGRRDAGACVDQDGDGRCAGDDCDDTDANRGGTEQCDMIDNDCDGNVDEGVSEICRDCEAGCTAHEIPGPGGWMPTDENADGVIVDDDGALTLGRNESMSFSVWVANMDEGTVSKLDSRTGNEVARYPTIGSMAPAGVRPWNEACGWCDPARGGCIGNCPSRSAVDQNFDAYVANRAFGNQGTVTKYANEESDCIDRNSNGMIDTSRDLNANGQIELGTAEFIGPDDECILWTAGVGNNDGVPRALSLGLAPPDGFVGDVWVGLFNQRQACRLNPMTGATIVCMDIGSFQPYGFAADSLGRVWAVDRSGARRDVLGYIDTGAMTFSTVANLPDLGGNCATPYGVTVDGAGDVFLANQCDPSIWRYRPSSGEWTAVDGGGAAFEGTPRGVATDETFLWVAISHAGDGFGIGAANRVRQYRLSDLSLVTEHTIPGSVPIGIGVSFDGSIWAINQGSNSASRLDPVSGVWTDHPVGLSPYTYSDFIGFGLNVFAEPNGHYSFVVEGCSNGANHWTGARYTAEIPPGTSVTVFARVADTREGLAALPWIGPFTANPLNFDEAPGPLPRGRFIEVDLRLATMDRTTAPRIFGIDVAGVCEPIIE
jgi:DNA-binding beta-propeller fold protein YncE